MIVWIPHVVDALFGLVKAQDSISSCLRHVDQLFIMTEGQPCGGRQTPQCNRPNTLLLHVDHKKTTLGVWRKVLTKRPTVSEENVT